jgi:hypothetical protein
MTVRQARPPLTRSAANRRYGGSMTDLGSAARTAIDLVLTADPTVAGIVAL